MNNIICTAYKYNPDGTFRILYYIPFDSKYYLQIDKTDVDYHIVLDYDGILCSPQKLNQWHRSGVIDIQDQWCVNDINQDVYIFDTIMKHQLLQRSNIAIEITEVKTPLSLRCKIKKSRFWNI